MTQHRNRRQVIVAGSSAAAFAAGYGSRALSQVPSQPVLQQPVRAVPTLPAIPIKQLQPRLTLPALPISRLTGALGSTGPWGEVQVRELPAGLVPIFVRTANRAGVMDLRSKRSSVSLANGAVILTPRGIQISGATQPWNNGSIAALIKRAKTDVSVRSSLIELRGALVTAYPHAIATSRRRGESKSTQAVATAAKAMGVVSAPRKSQCTTTTIVETVTREVEETVERWLTAEERFEKCVDQQVAAGIFGGEAGAWAYCAALGLADLFLGVVTVVTTIIEEVTRTVVTCALDTTRRLIDLYKGIEIQFPGSGIGFPGAGIIGSNALSSADISAALQRLKDLLGDASPFTTCLLAGAWSFAAADLTAITGGSKLEIPYGVKVCISSECARRLRLEGAGDNLQSAATSLLAILAALNTDFAAVASTLGIAKAAEAVAIAGALGATATTALTAVAALLLFLVYYAAMIALQMSLLPDAAFADGQVCIEHPTFVIAAVTLMLPGVGSLSQFTPPIVTG